MMYDMFNKIRASKGRVAVEKRHRSARRRASSSRSIPTSSKDHDAVDFVCDTMRMVLMGGVEAFDVDQMIEADMDVHAHERQAAGWRAEHHGRFAARAWASWPRCWAW